jgi:hypothetical protein
MKFNTRWKWTWNLSGTKEDQIKKLFEALKLTMIQLHNIKLCSTEEWTIILCEEIIQKIEELGKE